MSNERYVPPVREPIQPRTNPDIERGGSVVGGVSTFDRAMNRNADRSIDYNAKEVASNQAFMQFAQDLRIAPPAPLSTDLSVTSGVTSNGNIAAQPKYLYDPSSVLGLAGDLFSRFYSNTPSDTQQEPVIVGDTSLTSSGQSNGTGLFLVLIVLGIGGYFIYRRMKNA